jgi:AP2-associated kinase
VTYLASSVLQTAPDVHEVLILLELYTGGRVIDMMNARLKTGFPEEEVLRIFTDVCQAVARLHHRTKPIIHRDLKVENILRDSHGNYLLCDYGSCTVKMMHPEVLGAALCEEQIARYCMLGSAQFQCTWGKGETQVHTLQFPKIQQWLVVYV